MREGHIEDRNGLGTFRKLKGNSLGIWCGKGKGGVLYDLGRMFKVHLCLSHLVQHYQY